MFWLTCFTSAASPSFGFPRLDKYAGEGIENIENPNVLNVEPIRSLGTPMELIRAFGGKQQYEEAIRELEQQLYGAA
jgi:type I restriction enzyme R subunit